MTTARVLPDAGTLRADQAQRRQRIVDAAMQMMFDTDYDKIQVKDIAEQADVALGTLYRYFNSKDHLMACAIESWAASFDQRIEQSPSGSPGARVRATYRRAVRAFERQPRVYGALIHVQSSTDPYAIEVTRAFSQRLIGAFGDALESSTMSDGRRAAVVGVMSAVLDGSLRRWQLGHLPIASVYKAIDDAVDLIFPEG